MYYQTDMCCLCLNNQNNMLNRLNAYYDKINTAFPVLSFKKEYGEYLLCRECCDNIDSMYEFNNRCAKNLKTFIYYKELLGSPDKKHSTLNVKLSDLRNIQENPQLINEDDINTNHERDRSEDREKDDELISEVDTLNVLNKTDTTGVIKTEEPDVKPINLNQNHKLADGNDVNRTDDIRGNQTTSGNINQQIEGKEERTHPFSFTNYQENDGGIKVDIDIKIEELDIECEEPEVITRYFQEGPYEQSDSGASCDRFIETLQVPEHIEMVDVNNSEHQSNTNDDDSKIRCLSINEWCASQYTQQNPYTCNVFNTAYTEKSDFAINKSHTEQLATSSDLEYNSCNKDPLLIQSKEAMKYNRNHKDKKHYKSKYRTKDKKLYTCNVCQKEFGALLAFQIHKRIHTGEKPYKCNECDKRFTQKCNLKTHQAIHLTVKPYMCDICGKEFAQSKGLENHRFTHTGNRLYTCQICNKGLITARDLKVHTRIHTGEKPYQCDECDKCFTQQSNLKTHKLVHSGIKPYNCDECNEGFTHLLGLLKHKLIHTDQLGYRCDVCNMEFTESDELVEHELTHVDRKGYRCSVCNKRLLTTQSLRVHERTHTGIKPYGCDECEKAFATNWDLKMHKNIHSGLRMYKCDICEKEFQRPYHLKRHKFVHSSVKPYNCDLCNKGFTQRDNLLTHRLSAHMEAKGFTLLPDSINLSMQMP